jgi:hypothetical protein
MHHMMGGVCVCTVYGGAAAPCLRGAIEHIDVMSCQYKLYIYRKYCGGGLSSAFNSAPYLLLPPAHRTATSIP